MPRTLVLRREAMAELGTDDLRLVNGAALPSGVACPTGVTWCAAICDFVGKVVYNVETAVQATVSCI